MAGLYIHIPVCIAKCSYCDFVSMPMTGVTRKRYIDRLDSEVKERCKDIQIKTVYIGGGNPMALTIVELERVLAVANGVACKVKEFSIEANPESLTKAKAKLIKRYGVDRVSLGLQTHEDSILQAIGRRHSYKDFVSGVSTLREAGISNISAVIMLGLPNQSVAGILETVRRAVDLGLGHISVYGLKV